MDLSKGPDSVSEPFKIRLLIVDDHPIVLEGLRNMAIYAPGIELAGVCYSGEAALIALRKKAIDVVLVDLRMRSMNGIELLRRMRILSPHARGLVLSSYELEEEIFQAVSAGAAGYMSKDTLPSDILKGIATIASGGQVFPAYLLERIEQRRFKKGLTPRERQVLELVAKGLTNKEIAKILSVSQFTVRNQLRSLSTKLDASDRTEVARVAIEQGIIVL
jgi:DNA-binding NarL/FixJ family response regulator